VPLPLLLPLLPLLPLLLMLLLLLLPPPLPLLLGLDTAVNPEARGTLLGPLFWRLNVNSKCLFVSSSLSSRMIGLSSFRGYLLGVVRSTQSPSLWRFIRKQPVTGSTDLLLASPCARTDGR
jgi:hypothetical protein